MKTGIGLIGCGARLREVVKQVIKATDQVEVVALSDPSTHSLEAARKQFNPDAAVHAEYKNLVQDPAVDWVMVGSWNCNHAEHVIAALAAGKHVFCEKPLALTIEDCIAMREAWRKSGKQFVIGFTLRYSPHYKRIKELIENGVIGDVISVEANETLGFSHGSFIHSDWRRKTEWAGSHMLEKCSHDLDLLNWMLESKAVRVASFGGCNFFTPQNARHAERIGKDKHGHLAFMGVNRDLIYGNIVTPFNDDKDILDNQVVIIEFANGVRATFHTNCCTAIRERRMYICGTEGTLRANVIDGRIEVQRLGFETHIEDHSTDARGGHGDGDRILGEYLAGNILEGTQTQSSLEDGLRAAVTAFGIDEAQRTGQVFDLLPLWRMAGVEL